MATTQQIDPMAQLMLTFLGGSSDQSQSGTKTSDSTSTTSNKGSQTTKTTADTAALQDVLGRLLAGPSQQDIATIFQTGSKEVPGLQTAFAQAAGLRTDANSALENSLGDLQSRITGKVLDQKQQMLQTAAGVASALGQFSQSQTTTTDNTSSVGSKSTDVTKGTGSQDTSINSDKLRQLLIGGGLLGGLLGSDSGGYGPGIANLLKVVAGGKSLSDVLNGWDRFDLGGLDIPGGLPDLPTDINIPDIPQIDTIDWGSLFGGM